MSTRSVAVSPEPMTFSIMKGSGVSATRAYASSSERMSISHVFLARRRFAAGTVPRLATPRPRDPRR